MITKDDYLIYISHVGEQLFWDVKKKGEPHYVGDNVEELQFVKKSCEEVIYHVNRLLNEKNKHQ